MQNSFYQSLTEMEKSLGVKFSPEAEDYLRVANDYGLLNFPSIPLLLAALEYGRSSISPPVFQWLARSPLSEYKEALRTAIQTPSSDSPNRTDATSIPDALHYAARRAIAKGESISPSLILSGLAQTRSSDATRIRQDFWDLFGDWLDRSEREAASTSESGKAPEKEGPEAQSTSTSVPESSTERAPSPSPADLEWEKLLGRTDWSSSVRRALELLRDKFREHVEKLRLSGELARSDAFRISAKGIIAAFFRNASRELENQESIQNPRIGDLARRIAESGSAKSSGPFDEAELDFILFEEEADAPHPDSLIFSLSAIACLRGAEKNRARFSEKDQMIASRHIYATLLDPETSPFAVEDRDDSLRDIFRDYLESNPLVIQSDDFEEWNKFFQSIAPDCPPLKPREVPAEKAPPEAKPASTYGNRHASDRESADHELCLGIHQYAEAIAAVFNTAVENRDFVFALYGEWGRGKTRLIGRVFDFLKAEHVPKPPDYVRVNYSAWKFPSRPEVWVHLYQKIADTAKLGGIGQKLRIGFRVGIYKNGWAPLVLGFGLLLVPCFQPDFNNWILNGAGLLGVTILAAFAKSVVTLGKSFNHNYLTIPDHAEKLGLQAVVGDDLKRLLRVWIVPRKTEESGDSSTRKQDRDLPPPAAVPRPPDPRDFRQGHVRRSIAAIGLFIWLALFLTWAKFALNLPDPALAASTSPAGRDVPLAIDLSVTRKDAKLDWSGVPEKKKEPKEQFLALPLDPRWAVPLGLAAVGLAASFLIYWLLLPPHRHERIFLVIALLSKTAAELNEEIARMGLWRA